MEEKELPKRPAKESRNLSKFKNALRGTRDPRLAVSQLRSELDVGSYDAAARWLAVTPFRGQFLRIVDFPQQFSELCAKAPLELLSFEREVAWAVAILIPVSGRLTQFRVVAQRFSQALMRSDKQACSNILDQVESTFGKSIWSVKNRLATLQRYEGFDAQKAYLKRLRAESSDNGILQFLAHYVSVRNEAAISPGPFESMYNRHLAILPVDSVLKAYVGYHVLERPPLSSQDGAVVLAYDGIASAIDLYETLIALAAKWYRQRPSTFVETMPRHMARLSKTVADDRLRSLVYFGDSSVENFPELGVVPIAPYDEFLSGQYQSSLATAKRELAASPDSFEMIELSARAAHCCGITVTPESSREGSLNLEIADRMRSVLAKDANADENRIQLQKIALNFSGLDWASSIINFCEREMSSVPVWEAAHITLPRLMPPLKIHPLYMPVLDQRRGEYLDACRTDYSGSITLRYAVALSLGQADVIDTEVSLAHRLLAQAEQFAFEKQFERSLSAISADGEITYFSNKQIRLKAHCLLQLGRVAECVRYITDVYVRAPNLYSLVPIAPAFDAIPDPQAVGFVDDISVPILYDMYSRHTTSRKDYLRQYALEDFLAAYGVERPSRLRELRHKFDRRKLVYLLRYVCVPHVMDSSTVYSSSRELEDERIVICQLLAELDETNKDEYQSEITAITLRQAIHRGLRQIEQTKIYVDVEGIKEAATRELREGFNRYLAFERSKYASEQLREDVLREIIQKVRAGDKEVFIRLNLPKNEKADILETLIADIRDEFVASTEHGLNGYLSVRIRHGTFSGELRSPLEAAHLLTQREKGSTEYRQNEYWPQRLLLSSGSGFQIGRRLAEFSKLFDGIVERIVKEWIQIRKSDDDIGLFDFRIFQQSTRLAAAIDEDTTFERFLDMTLDALWERLDGNLAVMRDRLSTEAKRDIEELLTSLQSDLQALAGDENLSELENSIASARTEMSRTLTRVTGWFTLPVKSSNEPFSMTLAVGIASETVQRFYNQSLRSPVIVADDIQVVGSMLPSIVDIFVILFDNIVKHSDSQGAPEVKLSMLYDQKILRLCVANTIGKNARSDGFDERLAAIRDGIRRGEYKSVVTGEGGTGLFKIRKILDHEFGSRAKMEFGFTDGERFSVEIEIPISELVA